MRTIDSEVGGLPRPPRFIYLLNLSVGDVHITDDGRLSGASDEMDVVKKYRSQLHVRPLSSGKTIRPKRDAPTIHHQIA
jgi:hypothetical protein